MVPVSAAGLPAGVVAPLTVTRPVALIVVAAIVLGVVAPMAVEFRPVEVSFPTRTLLTKKFTLLADCDPISAAYASVPAVVDPPTEDSKPSKSCPPVF